MTKEKYTEFILDVLSATAEADSTSELFWRTDGNDVPVTFFINCNDLFYWGCADCEQLTPDNIEQLKQAYVDERALLGHNSYGGLLFCCRIRKMRPQGAYYKAIPPKLHALFNDAGPERETALFNPYTQDNVYAYEESNTEINND